MTISKLVSFLSGGDINSGFYMDDQATMTPGSRRIREAAAEPVPLEQLVLQLRQTLLGSHERVCEARFDEMIEILAEQKDVADIRYRAISTTTEALYDQINRLAVGVDARIAPLEQSLMDTLAKLREELETKLDILADNLRNALAEAEARSRSGLGEISQSFASHVAEDESKWQKERQFSLTSLEQRIAQWRAEIDDTRRQDMRDVASSMMDIGARLMALRQTEEERPS